MEKHTLLIIIVPITDITIKSIQVQTTEKPAAWSVAPPFDNRLVATQATMKATKTST